MRIVERIREKMDSLCCRLSEKKHGTWIALDATVQNVRFGGDNYIGEKSVVRDSSLGRFSYISHDCEITGAQIGSFTSIAPHCHVLIGNHPTERFVSTHPAFYSKERLAGRCFATDNTFEEYSYVGKTPGVHVRIGNDVWIASDVMILDGVNIGDGTVVAAGALVTKDTAPYSIVAGVPAKAIRYRFSDEQIRSLLELQWWNKDEKWLREHAMFFDDISEFITHMK